MHKQEILDSVLIALILISSSVLILELEVFKVFATSKTDSAIVCERNGYCQKN